MPLQRVDITPRILETAIEIKATNSLSVCDSWIAATAVATDSILVHKDPEFEQLNTIAKLKSLPYKAPS
jgi:predicted nucleic acid-binding protein